ncbi:MAG: hypothetical protein ACRCVW_01150 [Brevinema sp.]
MDKNNILEIFEELSEVMSAEGFENLCDEIKAKLQKRDRRSIELAVKYHGLTSVISFLDKPLSRYLDKFSRSTQRYIMAQCF